jgi:hypothetical protein
VNHIIGQPCVVLLPSFARVALHHEIPTLDIAKLAKLLEQGSPVRRTTGLSHLRYRLSGENKGDAIDLRRLLRQSCARTRHRTNNQRNEKPPLHLDPPAADEMSRDYQVSALTV